MINKLKHANAVFFTAIYGTTAGLSLRVAVNNSDPNAKIVATIIFVVMVMMFFFMMAANFTILPSFEDDLPETEEEYEYDDEEDE